MLYTLNWCSIVLSNIQLNTAVFLKKKKDLQKNQKPKL